MPPSSSATRSYTLLCRDRTALALPSRRQPSARRSPGEHVVVINAAFHQGRILEAPGSCYSRAATMPWPAELVPAPRRQSSIYHHSLGQEVIAVCVVRASAMMSSARAALAESVRRRRDRRGARTRHGALARADGVPRRQPARIHRGRRASRCSALAARADAGVAGMASTARGAAGSGRLAQAAGARDGAHGARRPRGCALGSHRCDARVVVQVGARLGELIGAVPRRRCILLCSSVTCLSGISAVPRHLCSDRESESGLSVGAVFGGERRATTFLHGRASQDWR